MEEEMVEVGGHVRGGLRRMRLFLYGEDGGIGGLAKRFIELQVRTTSQSYVLVVNIVWKNTYLAGDESHYSKENTSKLCFKFSSDCTLC